MSSVNDEREPDREGDDGAVDRDRGALRRRVEAEPRERLDARVAEPEPGGRAGNVASSSVSVSSWRAMRDRPAPSACRVASSFMRALERTSIRLVTLTAPTSSTNTTPPHSRIQRAPHVADQERPAAGRRPCGSRR